MPASMGPVATETAPLVGADDDHKARLSKPFAPPSVRRALLTPSVHPGSLHRGGKGP